MPPNREDAKAQIGLLVEKYHDAVRRRFDSRANEEEVRTKFVMPLLEALGWDVQGFDEVRPEQRTLTGRADFALRLPHERRPRLFIEVKRFDLGPDGLDGHTTRGGRILTFPQQAIQYAWQMQVSWAVLTNFKETRLYSSYIDPHRPQDGLVFSLESNQYLQKFDQLWQLSKEAVASGGLDASEKKRRRETIYQEAPADLFECRQVLAADMHLHNPTLQPSQVQEAVQRILDRLIVVRVAEDRLILPSEAVWTRYDAWKKTQIDDSALFVKSLKEFFRQVDSIYNSKLFSEHFCEDVHISNAALAEVLGILYDFNFDLIDADILGSIYEGYLGHVLTASRGEVRFERRDQTRKRRGVYYTPTYVVEYIVDKALGPFLVNRPVNEVQKLRILDPSCGSGSFLIKAYDRLADYYSRYNVEARQTARGRRTLAEHEARPAEVIDYQKLVLRENLFAVDIDEQAVELAAVNLMLKALRRGEKLPLILDENIRVGNSLISGSEEMLQTFFGDRWKERKPFEWQNEFPQVFQSGGFDVVLGNPPYVDIYTIPEAERRYFLSGRFASAFKKFDLYVLFIELGVRLLKDHGRLSFIVPDRLLTAVYAKPLRELLLNECAIELMVDLSEVKVFQHQSVRNIIVVLRKETDVEVRRMNRVRIVRVDPTTDLREGITGPEEEIPQRVFEEAPDFEFRFALGKEEVRRAAEKMENGTTLLGKLYYVNWGLRTGTAEKTRTMITKDASHPDARPLIRGDNILDRYLVQYTGDHIIYDRRRLYNPMFPELFENRKIVIRKITGGKGLFASLDDKGYYAFSTVIVALPYHLVEGSPRARVPDGASELSQGYDPLFILGLLNSKAMRFYYRFRVGDELSVVPNHVKRLPVPKASLDVQDRIGAAASQLLELRRAFHEEEPLTHLDRLVSSRSRALDESLSSYIARLEDKDIQVTGGLDRVFRADSISIEASLVEDWLTLDVRYREKGLETPQHGALRCRHQEPVRTYLYHVLKSLPDRGLGRGRVMGKLRGIKIPHFDGDWDRHLAVVAEIVSSLKGHERRVSEVRTAISRLEKEIDEAVYGLFALGENDILMIESQS